MRILYIANVADLYGASRSLLRLAGRVAAEGHQVEVILPGDGPLGQLLRQGGIRTAVCPNLAILRKRLLRSPVGWARLLARTFRSTVWLVRKIKAFRPDLVHSNSAVILSGGLAAKLCRVPHVWHVREFLSGENPLWAVYQWYMALFSKRILCISNAVRRQFCGLLRRCKTLVVHNGLPAEEFLSPAAERVHPIRQRFGTPKVWIGVAGRIHLEQKGQDVFLKAAAEVARQHPQAHFVIVGTPYPGNEEHERRLRHLIEELGLADRVTLMGEVKEMTEMYDAVDLWVLPARKPEGLGNVLIEAMAMSKPVIGSAIGGIPEIIDHGVNGLLVPPGNPQALAAAISYLLSNAEERRRMGQAGRQKFYEKFELERCCRSLLSLYESLLAPERAAETLPAAQTKGSSTSTVSSS